MKYFILPVFLCMQFFALAQAPKRELRAAWIATVSNIDWPSSSSLTPAAQQAQLIAILDNHKATGLNAIYLQVRSQCDAIYPSTIVPFASIFTGTQGVAPVGYDPLQFAITECRKRGIEVHAWFNPYRAISSFSQINSFSPNHIARTRPDLLLDQGTLRILDPGKFEVIDSVIKAVMDVVRRYDIDGVHYDDYFYPYPPTAPTIAFNDDATFAAFPRGFTNKNDWRRANVDSMVKRTGDSVKAAKPWVKYGISPFGIWRNTNSGDATGSATNGLQSYSDIYANSKLWIAQNWVDYLTPQIYWSIGFTVANYGVLIPWWNSNAGARHIYSGMASYRVNNGGTDLAAWANTSQIPNQIVLNRGQTKVLGSVFYNTTTLNANALGHRDSLRNNYFKRSALIPAMPWKDNIAPDAPTALMGVLNANNVALSWTPPAATTVELQKARQYVVYRFNSATTDLTDSSTIRTVTPVDSIQFIDANVPVGNYYYVVTALDRLYNESLISNVLNINNTTTAINNINQSVAVFKAITVSNNEPILLYHLIKKGQVNITIHASNGKRILTQNLGVKNAGVYTFNIPNNKLIAGVYTATLQINGASKTIKFIK
jgi:uncharacterized lipoprotein YddW (UPF0748 family)